MFIETSIEDQLEAQRDDRLRVLVVRVGARRADAGAVAATERA